MRDETPKRCDKCGIKLPWAEMEYQRQNEELSAEVERLQYVVEGHYSKAVYWAGDIVPSVVHQNDCTINHSTSIGGPCSCGTFARLTHKPDQVLSYKEATETIDRQRTALEWYEAHDIVDNGQRAFTALNKKP